MIIYMFLFCLFIEAAYPEGHNCDYSLVPGVPSDFKETADPFTKIGSKYYVIENQNATNWFAAAMKCREMGGNLANIQSHDDLQAITKYLDKSKRYWLDLNDLGLESEYRSLTTGKLMGSYPLWNAGEPNNRDKVEHCVHLFHNGREYVINDYDCQGSYLYICETNYPRTLRFVTW